MKLVTYNIQFTRGRDGRHDARRIASEVQGADLIALQEVDRYWPRSGNSDQAVEIASHLQGYYWVYGAGVDLAIDGPDSRAAPQRRRQFGNMLLSRSPILYSRNHLLPKYASLGPISVQRCALETLVEIGGQRLRVYSIHLTHLAAETRLPQVDALLSIHANAPREGPPLMGEFLNGYWDAPVASEVPHEAILLGDFNFEPDSAEYARIVGPVSPYGGRMTNPEGFVDAWIASGGAEDEGRTANLKGRPVRLDYCFVSAILAARIRTARVDQSARGSDHQPLWVELDR